MVALRQPSQRLTTAVCPTFPAGPVFHFSHARFGVSRSPVPCQRTAQTIGARSLRNHGGKRNLLDSPVIRRSMWKERMGKGRRGITPQTMRGLLYP
jgi:hypothetical protein